MQKWLCYNNRGALAHTWYKKGGQNLAVGRYEYCMHSCFLYCLFVWHWWRGFFSQHVDMFSFLQNNTYLKTEQFPQTLNYPSWICGQPHHTCREEQWHVHAASARWWAYNLEKPCTNHWVELGLELKEEVAKTLAADPGKPSKITAYQYNALNNFTEHQYISQWKGAHWHSPTFHSRQKNSLSLQAHNDIAFCHLSISLCEKPEMQREDTISSAKGLFVVHRLSGENWIPRLHWWNLVLWSYSFHWFHSFNC